MNSKCSSEDPLILTWKIGYKILFILTAILHKTKPLSISGILSENTTKDNSPIYYTTAQAQQGFRFLASSTSKATGIQWPSSQSKSRNTTKTTHIQRVTHASIGYSFLCMKHTMRWNREWTQSSNRKWVTLDSIEFDHFWFIISHNYNTYITLPSIKCSGTHPWCLESYDAFLLSPYNHMLPSGTNKF